MILQKGLSQLRRWASHSNRISRSAVLLRNQLDGIIYLHLGHDPAFDRNGEAWILEQLGPQVRTFIDVGANVGEWTQQVLEYAHGDVRGLACEPNETAFAPLSANLSGEPRVQLIRAAVSDFRGETTFFAEPDAGRTSSMVEGFSQATARATTVATRTVDDLADEAGMERVDYLKIDVEGHDLHGLRGAEELLAKQAIRFLQFEYNEPWRRAGSSLADAMNLLHEHDYRCMLLKRKGLYDFPYDVYGDFFHYANFVAFPRSRHNELSELMRGSV